MKSLIFTLLTGILFPFSILTAQTPVSAGALVPLDTDYWNFDFVFHNGKTYYLGKPGAGDDVEWFVYDPATGNNTQISNHFHGASNGTVVTNRVVIGNNLFFTGYVNAYEAEFYRIDLTNDQLYTININNSTCLTSGNPIASAPGNFTEGPGGKVYFTAISANEKTQVFVWDPATPNTVTQLTSYNPNGGLSVIHGGGFVLANNRIVFPAYTGTILSGGTDPCDNTKPGYSLDNRELVVFNLADNSITVHEINTGTYLAGSTTYNNNSSPESFFNINGQVYFQARTGGSNLSDYQLCRIDLNAPTPSVSVLSSFVNVQSSAAIRDYKWDGADKLYFVLTTYSAGVYLTEEIYSLTISTGQITRLTNYNSMDYYPVLHGIYNGNLYFSDYNPEAGLLFVEKMDLGTNSITLSANNGFTYAWNREAVFVGNKLFLNGDLLDGAGDEMLSLDLAGNTLVRHGDIEPGADGSMPMLLQTSGNDLLFLAYSGGSYSLYEMQDAFTTLPVKLITFKAALAGKKAQLTWTTAEESNNKGFEILRSVDGANFTKVGWVAARTQPGSYRFEELLSATGAYYYRLRQLDIDGRATLSALQKLSLNDDPRFSFINQPTQINLQSPVKGLYQVVDMQGRIVSTGNIVAGHNTVNTQKLLTGIYQLNVLNQQGSRVYSGKFSK